MGVGEAPSLVHAEVLVKHPDHPELGHHEGTDDVAEGVADAGHGFVIAGVDHAEEEGLAAQAPGDDLEPRDQPLRDEGEGVALEVPGISDGNPVRAGEGL